jgi:hypothetical protein
MNATTSDNHAEYIDACKLAVDAAAASAEARAAWKKLEALERKASELFAAAMHAYQTLNDSPAVEGCRKASRKHWHSSYVVAAGFQKVYERR